MIAAGSRGVVVAHGPQTTKHATAHGYVANPEAPGTCRHCRLIKGHRLHSPAEVGKADAERDAAAAEERRRLGELD